jgi:hypothetical protein
MKNIWLLILSMIPGFMVAEQSWPEWTFDTARYGIGQSLKAITDTVSTAKDVVKNADSADVTVAAIPVLYGRKLYKLGKSFDWKQATQSLYANPTLLYANPIPKISKLKVLRFFKPVPTAVAIGFMHHALTSHTPMRWAENQKKKS